MDILFDIIAFLFKALVDSRDPNKASPPRSQQPRAQMSTPRTQSGSQPLAPPRQPYSLDPAYDGEGWRLALTVLAFIVLVVMVAAWYGYSRGWLFPG